MAAFAALSGIQLRMNVKYNLLDKLDSSKSVR